VIASFSVLFFILNIWGNDCVMFPECSCDIFSRVDSPVQLLLHHEVNRLMTIFDNIFFFNRLFCVPEIEVRVYVGIF
jgi:hypothetical protein